LLTTTGVSRKKEPWAGKSIKVFLFSNNIDTDWCKKEGKGRMLGEMEEHLPADLKVAGSNLGSD
jgi:hypothetical protein